MKRNSQDTFTESFLADLGAAIARGKEKRRTQTERARRFAASNGCVGRPPVIYRYRGMAYSAQQWTERLGLARRESFYSRLAAFKAGRCDEDDVYRPVTELRSVAQKRRRSKEQRAYAKHAREVLGPVVAREVERFADDPRTLAQRLQSLVEDSVRNHAAVARGERKLVRLVPDEIVLDLDDDGE